MPDTTYRPESSARPQAPKRFGIAAPIHLQFPGEEHALSAQLGNISEKGMFVISEITYPASTEFNFRVNDPDPRLSVTGRGQVAWRRQLASGELRPAGMGCEILRLTEESRNALGNRIASLTPKEILRSPPDRRSLTQEISRQDIHETLSKQQFERPEYFRTMGGKAPRRKNRRLRPHFWILSGLAFLAVAAFGLHRSGVISLPTLPPPEAMVAHQAQDSVPLPANGPIRENANGSTATNPSTEPLRGPQNDVSAPLPKDMSRQDSGMPQANLQPSNDSVALSENAPSDTPQPQQDRETQSKETSADAVRLARAWASSWSSQATNDYLEFYAKTFRPSDGVSRRAWIQDRQRKLTIPEFIEVSLEKIEFDGDENAGTLTFLQAYRSNVMQDQVEKTMKLVREDGGWKIVSEISEPLG